MTRIEPNTASKMRARGGPSLCFSPCLGPISSLLFLQEICGSERGRYAWDMDPARKSTASGRWKNTQELAAMPPPKAH
jgi:hypothetical protein